MQHIVPNKCSINMDGFERRVHSLSIVPHTNSGMSGHHIITCSHMSESSRWSQLKLFLGKRSYFINEEDGFYRSWCYSEIWEKAQLSSFLSAYLHELLVFPASLPCTLVTCSFKEAASSPETLHLLILKLHEVEAKTGLPWLPGDEVKRGFTRLPPCCRFTWSSTKELGFLPRTVHICQEMSNIVEFVNRDTRELDVWVHLFLLGTGVYNQRFNQRL